MKWCIGFTHLHFGAFKYGKTTDKPMVPSVKKQLLGIKRNGVLCPAKWVNCGARGWQLQDRTYRFPSSGFRFPSRNGAKEPHHNKDRVIHAICDVRDAFIEKYERRYPSLNGKKPRTARAEKILQDAYVAGRREEAKELGDKAADFRWCNGRRLHLEGEKEALQRLLGWQPNSYIALLTQGPSLACYNALESMHNCTCCLGVRIKGKATHACEVW